MAELTPQQADLNGLNISFDAASGGGDTVRPARGVLLLVRNDDASGHTVTVAVPGATKFGPAYPDVTSASIPAGEVAVFKLDDADLADPTDGLVHLSYDGVTAVGVAAVRG